MEGLPPLGGPNHRIAAGVSPGPALLRFAALDGLQPLQQRSGFLKVFTDVFVPRVHGLHPFPLLDGLLELFVLEVHQALIVVLMLVGFLAVADILFAFGAAGVVLQRCLEALNGLQVSVLRHHGIDLLTHAGKAGSNESYLRILIPAASPKTVVPFKRPTLLPVNRPVFFDFDLFNRPEVYPDLDDRILADLSYTVFDTETTGLDPRGGDEIISIGAVRIINGKMLEEESFERLVNPQRMIPWSSVQIHGIQPQMLERQPSIAQVLPKFYNYVEGTVLVGHNVAFDMRLLQEKEAATGIRFGNPVLDTMLISEVVNPTQQRHDLEAIADRLGVVILGRHTALGDAIGTAEIFLKMLPLLDGLGIQTLKQAREASQESYLARLKY